MKYLHKYETVIEQGKQKKLWLEKYGNREIR